MNRREREITYALALVERSHRAVYDASDIVGPLVKCDFDLAFRELTSLRNKLKALVDANTEWGKFGIKPTSENQDVQEPPANAEGTTSDDESDEDSIVLPESTRPKIVAFPSVSPEASANDELSPDDEKHVFVQFPDAECIYRERKPGEPCPNRSPNGACKVTILASNPPQYNMCPFCGDGYIKCSEA